MTHHDLVMLMDLLFTYNRQRTYFSILVCFDVSLIFTFL